MRYEFLFALIFFSVWFCLFLSCLFPIVPICFFMLGLLISNMNLFFFIFEFTMYVCDDTEIPLWDRNLFEFQFSICYLNFFTLEFPIWDLNCLNFIFFLAWYLNFFLKEVKKSIGNTFPNILFVAIQCWKFVYSKS